MRGLTGSILLSAVLIVALWLVGQAFGFQMSLLGSLGMTIVLTIVATLVFNAWGRRRSRPRRW